MRRYSVPEPWLEEGFVPIPKRVLLDASLSAGARVAYAILLDFAWRSKGDPEPELEEIGALLGVKYTTARGYIKELEKAGIVRAIRQGPGRPNRYEIAVSAEVKKSGKGTSRSPEMTGPNARATGPGVEEKLEAAPNGTAPAETTEGHRRNLIFDRLVEVCDAAPEPRATGVAAAKISRLCSDEYTAVLPSNENQEGYTLRRIGEQAATYRNVMGDALLTPSALAKWWESLPKLENRKRGTGRLTADEIFADAQRMAAAAHVVNVDPDGPVYDPGGLEIPDLELDAKEDG